MVKFALYTTPQDDVGAALDVDLKGERGVKCMHKYLQIVKTILTC